MRLNNESIRHDTHSSLLNDRRATDENIVELKMKNTEEQKNRAIDLKPPLKSPKM